MTALAYSLVSPTRDEADNLVRLAESVTSQSVLPRSWIIVDNGSTDRTPALIGELEAKCSWIRGATSPPTAHPEPGAPIVRALAHGSGSARQLRRRGRQARRRRVVRA